MAGKNRPGQIIKRPFSLLAAITSTFLMAVVPVSLGELVGLTVRAPDPEGPTQTANFLATLGKSGGGNVTSRLIL
jgi:hypothetical protein